MHATNISYIPVEEQKRIPKIRKLAQISMKPDFELPMIPTRLKNGRLKKGGTCHIYVTSFGL